MYYEKTTTGAPSAPTGATYTFSTGVVSGTGINDAGTTNVWKNSPNTQDATSSNTFYTVRYYGTEASAGSTTITTSYSSVVQQTSFTGVVTFSGGTTLTDGSSTIDPLESSDLGPSGTTTIDGGRITTGSIQSANYVDNGSSDFSTSGSKFDLSNNVVETKYFYSKDAGAGFAGTVTVGGTDLTVDNTLNENTTPDDVGLETLTLIASGGKTLTFTGNRISVSGGTAGQWDTDAVSKNGFNTAFVSFKVTNAFKAFSMGLDSAPDASDHFNSIDYAWYISSTASILKDGNLSQPLKTNISFSVGDIFSLTFDGFAFRFYKNGTLEHTETHPSATTPLYLDSSFFATNFNVDAVQFGPLGYSDYGAAGSPVPGINWGGGSWNIQVIPNSNNGTADTDPGEIYLTAGTYVLPDNTTRTLSTAAQIQTPFEVAVRPNDSGGTDNVFYAIWGASTPDTRFGSKVWGNTAAENAGLFAAVYNRESKKWYAVSNDNSSVEFTPAATDYVIVTGVKTSTSGGLDRVTPTVALATNNGSTIDSSGDISGAITMLGSGTITAGTDANNKIVIDGNNKRITITDNGTVRIIIGNLP